MNYQEYMGTELAKTLAGKKEFLRYRDMIVNFLSSKATGGPGITSQDEEYFSKCDKKHIDSIMRLAFDDLFYRASDKYLANMNESIKSGIENIQKTME